MKTSLLTLAAFAAALALHSGTAEAHGKPKNLKVIQPKNIKKGMKLLNKAFHVKCTACHIKKKWAKDKVKAKDLTRDYLKLSLSGAPAPDQEVALKALLKAIKRDEVKKPKKLAKLKEVFALKQQPPKAPPPKAPAPAAE